MMRNWLDDDRQTIYDRLPAWKKTSAEEVTEFLGRILALKGTEKTILALLLATNKIYSKKQLKGLTGSAYLTISQSLAQLVEAGFVTEVAEQRWQISPAWKGEFQRLILGESPGSSPQETERP